MYPGYSSQFIQGQASNPPNPYINQPCRPLYPIPVPQMGYPPNSYGYNQPPPNYYNNQPRGYQSISTTNNYNPSYNSQQNPPQQYQYGQPNYQNPPNTLIYNSIYRNSSNNIS